MYKFFCLFIVLLGLLSACEKSVELPLPPHDPKIVVNARLSAGDSIEVYVSRSYGPLEDVDSENIQLTDATVEILDNGQSLGQLAYRDTTVQDFWGSGEIILGKYVLRNHLAQADHTYSIKVSHPDYESVTAETTVPKAMKITQAEVAQNAFRKVYGDGYAEYQSLLRITVDDPAAIENFYRINHLQITVRNTFEPSIPDSIFTMDIYVEGVAEEAGDGGYEALESYGKDETFDGTSGTIDFLCYLPTSDLAPNEIFDMEFTELIITSLSANADWYQYIDKVNLQRGSDIDDIGLFPSESVVVYTNVENGYGIFGAATKKTVQIPQ